MSGGRVLHSVLVERSVFLCYFSGGGGYMVGEYQTRESVGQNQQDPFADFFSDSQEVRDAAFDRFLLEASQLQGDDDEDVMSGGGLLIEGCGCGQNIVYDSRM
jgi:hypothetical protein